MYILKVFWHFHLNRDSKLQTLCSCRHCVVRFMTSFRWESYYFSIEWGGKKIEHKYLFNLHKLFLEFFDFFSINKYQKRSLSQKNAKEWLVSSLDIKHQFCVYFLKNFKDLTFVYKEKIDIPKKNSSTVFTDHFLIFFWNIVIVMELFYLKTQSDIYF